MHETNGQTVGWKKAAMVLNKPERHGMKRKLADGKIWHTWHTLWSFPGAHDFKMVAKETISFLQSHHTMYSSVSWCSDKAPLWASIVNLQ